MKSSIAIVLLLLTVCSTGFAQTERKWSLALTNGETADRVHLTSFRNDTLYFLRSANFADWTLLDSLKEIRRSTGGVILPATIIGAVAGGAIGYSIKPATRNDSETNIYGMLFGIVIGGGIGYGAGALLTPVERYDFTVINRELKRETLKRLAGE